MFKLLQCFRQSKKGATAVEYALLAVMIALAVIVSSTELGEGLRESFSDTADKVSEAVS